MPMAQPMKSRRLSQSTLRYVAKLAPVVESQPSESRSSDGVHHIAMNASGKNSMLILKIPAMILRRKMKTKLILLVDYLLI